MKNVFLEEKNAVQYYIKDVIFFMLVFPNLTEKYEPFELVEVFKSKIFSFSGITLYFQNIAITVEQISKIIWKYICFNNFSLGNKILNNLFHYEW